VLARIGLPILAGVLPFILYVTTACRDLFWVDSTEFMLVGRFLTVAHPPGYPLLVLIIRLVSMIPVLALPFRLNLIPALAAAGSCLMVYFILTELTRDRLAAFLSALLWGVSFELWQQATALEVYALQAFLLSVLLLAMVKWAGPEVQGPESKVQSPRSAETRWLLLAFFAFGLALANHTPILLWIPSVLIMVCAAPARPGPRALGFGLLLTLLAVCLYTYVLLRSSAVTGQFWSGVNTLPDLFQFVSGKVYRYRLLAGGTGYLEKQALGLPALFGRQFLVAWLLVIPGAVALWRRSKALLGALLLGALAVTVAATAYNIPDKEGHLLPAYLAMLIVIGCGFAALRRTRARSVLTIAAAPAMLLPLIFLPDQNRSRLRGLSDLSRTVLTPVAANSVVLTDDYSLFHGLRWQQQVQGLRPDVKVVSQHHLALPWYLDQLGTQLPVPAEAAALGDRLWQHQPRVDDAGFGEAAKATAEQVMYLLVQNWRKAHRVFWFSGNFSDWPQDWHGLRLTMQGLGYEIEAKDTTPDLTSPIPSPGTYRTTLYRDPETQDLCRRFAATACRRGILWFAQDSSTRALTNFDLALEYFPVYAQAIENKGIVFFFSGQPDSARAYLERFIALDPSSPDIPKARQILSRIR
jgi:hypothetical protein